MSTQLMQRSLFMGKRSTNRDIEDEITRLRTFLVHAKLEHETDQTSLAKELGMTKGAITHALRRGVSAEMKDALDAWGLDREFWTSPDWTTPANFMRKGPRKSAIEREASDNLDRILHLARARKLPNEQLGKLVAVPPPPDRRTDPWWYFERLLALEDEASAPPASGAPAVTRSGTGRRHAG